MEGQAAMTALRKTARVRRMWAHKQADVLRQEVLAMTAVKGKPKGYHKFTQQVAVVSLTPESIEALVEKAAEEIAFAIAAAYARGTLDGMVVNEKREDYECARKVVTAILGKTGRGK